MVHSGLQKKLRIQCRETVGLSRRLQYVLGEARNTQDLNMLEDSHEGVQGTGDPGRVPDTPIEDEVPGGCWDLLGHYSTAQGGGGRSLH